MEKPGSIQAGNEYLRLVEQLVKELKYGSLTIILQDGKVVQIEKNEKIRL